MQARLWLVGALMAAGLIVPPSPSPPPVVPDAGSSIAVAAALAQLGLPYEWGGNGPAAGDVGFDCSGLTRFAYLAAGVRLPRTAFDQFYAGPVVSSDVPLEPGDLVFYGTAEDIHHVGLYLGEGRMVNASTFGEPIKVAYSRWPGDNYFGATRPGVDVDAVGVEAAPERPNRLPQRRGNRIFAAPSATWVVR